MGKVSLTDPPYATDSKEDQNGVPMVVDAVPVYPGVDGSSQTSKGDGSSEVSLSAESKMVDEDDATDGDEGGGETESAESESDDDSLSEESSSSSSSEEEEEDGDSHGTKEDTEDREEAFIGSEDEEEVVRGPIKSENELEELLPVPQIEVTLEPHHQLLPVGAISSILGTRVVVEGSVNHNPLNEGSVLWITDSRYPLGLVDEIFGPVKCPYYIVRYNSEKDVPAGIGKGTAVSFVMEFANKILNEKDLYRKGYDASGENDEEVTDEVEFSDDEKEAEYKRSLSQEKRGIDDKRRGNRQNASRKKKTRSKGAEPRKGLQPLLPRGPVAMNQLPPGVSGPQASSLGANNSASGRGSCSLGAASACVSAPPIAPSVPPAMNSAGCPSTMSHQFLQQQPHAMWAPGMPPLQQPNAFWPCGMPPPPPPWPLPLQQPNAFIGGLQMNGLPSQQLGGHAHQQHYQNQASNGNMNVMPSQQQFLPLFGATPNMPCPFRPSDVYAGPMNPMAPPWLLRPAGVGQGNISVQGSSVLGDEHGYQQTSPAIVRAGMLPPLQFNLGSSSVHGSKTNVRGDGHSGRRGGRRRRG